MKVGVGGCTYFNQFFVIIIQSLYLRTTEYIIWGKVVFSSRNFRDNLMIMRLTFWPLIKYNNIIFNKQ
jgi:hypothetical protein